MIQVNVVVLDGVKKYCCYKFKTTPFVYSYQRIAEWNICTLDSRALLFSRACLKKRLPKGRENYDVRRVGARIPRKIVVLLSATNKNSSKKREKISPGAEGDYNDLLNTDFF